MANESPLLCEEELLHPLLSMYSVCMLSIYHGRLSQFLLSSAHTLHSTAYLPTWPTYMNAMSCDVLSLLLGRV